MGVLWQKLKKKGKKMAGMVTNPSSWRKSLILSEDDEVLQYGEGAGDVPFGFHCVSADEARKLAMCDWLDPVVQHECATDSEDGGYCDYDELETDYNGDENDGYDGRFDHYDDESR